MGEAIKGEAEAGGMESSVQGSRIRRWWWLSKNRKSKMMNATMLLLNLAYLGNPSVEAVEYVSEGLCTADQQRGILEAVTGCTARETLVDLREHMPNVSNVIQVSISKFMNTTIPGTSSKSGMNKHSVSLA